MAQVERIAVRVDKIKRFTARAVLIEVDKREVWVPASQVHNFSTLDRSDTPVELFIAPWFVKKEGLL